jgi:hypothetical protein
MVAWAEHCSSRSVWQRFSPHGRQGAERKRRLPGIRQNLQRHAHSDLLPLTRLYIPKLPPEYPSIQDIPETKHSRYEHVGDILIMARSGWLTPIILATQ